MPNVLLTGRMKWWIFCVFCKKCTTSCGQVEHFVSYLFDSPYVFGLESKLIDIYFNVLLTSNLEVVVFAW